MDRMKSHGLFSGSSLRVSSSNRNTTSFLIRSHPTFRDDGPDFLPKPSNILLYFCQHSGPWVWPNIWNTPIESCPSVLSGERVTWDLPVAVVFPVSPHLCLTYLMTDFPSG